MKKYVIPSLVFALSACLALYNIGNFPKMIGDEGIYVSQAYWLTHLGQLGPYTYWYDHFPLGWAQVGVWQLLTGPTSFLGYSVLSARVFMGLVLGGTTTLLYLLSKQLTGSKLMALISSVLFITSTLTLTFGRMVLLDNLAVFWLLLSLVLLYRHPTRIKHVAFSALTLSLAILSKESLLFFLPPYLFTLYRYNRTNPHKKYALLIGCTTIIFALSLFPLLAMLKGELVPQTNQVSLLGTLFFQAQRGSGILFWNSASHFRQMLTIWTSIDPILIILGAGSTLLMLALPVAYDSKSISVLTVFFLLFLMRGGQIYDFYIIPLVPLLVLNTMLLLHYCNKVSKTSVLTWITLLGVLSYFVTSNHYPFTAHATIAQTESIDALKALPEKSNIVANNYAYLDVYLQQKNQINWYQKIESDPEVRAKASNPTDVLVDVQFAGELSGHELPFIESKLSHPATIAKFGVLPAPGQNVKPYTTEFLSLYHIAQSGTQIEELVSLSTINGATLTVLADNPPYGIFITKNDFSSSTDLQGKLALIKQILPSSLIFTTQDGEGNNAIPWIPTVSRSLYKSALEAKSATSKKSEALKALGFDGAVITSSDDTDTYLVDIVSTGNTIFTTLVRYNGTLPTTPADLVVDNEPDLKKIQQMGYAGKILELKNLP